MRIEINSRWIVVLLATLLLQACGGGGGGGGSLVPSSAAVSNTVAIKIGAGVSTSTNNMMLASVTLCQPDSSSCVTIPNIQIDTGSTGLRVFASLLHGVALPPVPSGTGTLYNCAAFGDGVVWGNMATADVKIGEETAKGISVHILQDTGAGAPIPTPCSQQGPNETSILGTTTINAFGVNGVLGIGLFNQDCGTYCTNFVFNPAPKYYDCTSSAPCTGTTATLAQQTANPVASFTDGNNQGVALQFPVVANTGAVNVNGTLIFGINTQANNTESGSAIKVSTPYASNGYFTSTYRGVGLTQSIIDSGSAGYYFNDATIGRCSVQSAYFCPVPGSNSLSPLSISALFPNSNTNSASQVSMQIANADVLFGNTPTLGAFNDVGAPNSANLQSFDFGAPFFFGKTVFTSNENVGIANMHVAFQAYNGN